MLQEVILNTIAKLEKHLNKAQYAKSFPKIIKVLQNSPNFSQKDINKLKQIY